MRGRGKTPTATSSRHSTVISTENSSKSATKDPVPNEIPPTSSPNSSQKNTSPSETDNTGRSSSKTKTNATNSTSNSSQKNTSPLETDSPERSNSKTITNATNPTKISTKDQVPIPRSVKESKTTTRHVSSKHTLSQKSDTGGHDAKRKKHTTERKKPGIVVIGLEKKTTSRIPVLEESHTESRQKMT